MIKTTASMVFAAMLLVTGCGNTAVTTAVPPDSSTVSVIAPPESASIATSADVTEKDFEMKAEDVAAAVNGISDHYLRQNAVNIDYMNGVTTEDKAVKDISVNEEDVKKVDSSKTGKYKVSYTVTIDKDVYMQEHAENEKAEDVGDKNAATNESVVKTAAENAEKPADAKTDTNGNKADKKEQAAKEDADVTAFGGGTLDTMIVVDVDEAITSATIDTMITVVSDDEIGAIIGSGGTVWDSNNEVIDSEDDIPKPTETPKPTATPKPQDPPAADNHEEPTYEEPEPQPSQPEQPAHTHTWEPVYGTVHHEGTPEQGHTQRVQTGAKTVVDREAVDVPIYEWHTVCSCGAILANSDEAYEHMEMGHSYGDARVQVGVEHIEAETHEEPIYEDVYVVDKPAEPGYDETVVTGYRCSGCGATK